ncbi:MAG: putative baseplate assembly protein [Alphaproteobacteria bacterium]|nr:putative baseplate assembly protein [Alphaproteobacteria bacterium]MCB9791550.1 putative baseplate assembly protein [Alphaproteobacteria bacterium]
MPIRPPRLDDRTYPDLVDELVARIPAHAPEYTNPQPGDPGITLIELFAWLADTVLYRANVIPERQRLEFLRLLGQPMRGARAATGLVSLAWADLDKAAPRAETLRPWCKVKGPVDFETRSLVTVLPVEGQVWHKRKLLPEEEEAVDALLDDLGRLYELGDAKPKPYVSTPLFPESVAAPRGVDLIAQSVDGCLWIALLAGAPEWVEDARTTLGRNDLGLRQVLSVGVVPVLEGDDQLDESLVGGLDTRRPVPVTWEVVSPAGGGTRYYELEVQRDGTRGLTRAGVVELLLPDAVHMGNPSNDVNVDLDAGVGPRPPRLDDDELAARLVTWVRLRPRKSVDTLRLAWVGINAVQVDQRRTLQNLVIGRSDGAADQRMAVGLGGLEPENFALEVEEEGRGWVPWARVDHLSLAGRDDRVFALDDEEGIVQFGDGLRGRIPEIGRKVRVAYVRGGGGVAGNLPPGSLSDITGKKARGAGSVPALKLTQPLETRGGAAAETLEEAERRVPELLRHRNRAVTLQDYVSLAAATPGVPLGRVEILKGFKPHQRRSNVPGVVSVMVLPQVDGVMPPNPRPGQHTIEAVHAWLSPRVPLATELYVMGCEYKPIGVSVGFELREGYDRDATTAAVRMAMRRMLWPLAPGGPFEDASGWPRGRHVRGRELWVAVARVPGVDEVMGVQLFTREDDGTWTRVTRVVEDSVQIDLQPWQLPELLRLSVTADESASTSLSGTDAAQDIDGLREVAIPVVPEVC